ncbi:MAG: OB-fold-containig protein [Pseudomonadota bacterium]
MSSFSLLLSPEAAPFAVALGVVAALCLLELAMMLAGLSLIGDAGGGPEADIEADLDAVLDLEAELDAAPDLDAAPGELVDGDALDSGTANGAIGAGVLSWLGLGAVPFAIWLAGTLTAFGLTGYVLQLGAVALLGVPIAALPAAALALLPGLALGGRFARLLGGLVPKTETAAISSRAYGGRRGVITTGTARRGVPAEARFRDGHGNTHYARVEPLDDAETLEAGTEVAILRLRDGRLRAVRASD